MLEQSKSFTQLDTLKLKKIPLFSDLNDSELESLRSICTLKHFSANEIVFFETEPYRGFYCVLKGKVRIFKVSKDGKEHTIHFIGENNTFAEVPMFEKYSEDSENELTYPANAIAIEDGTQVILINKKYFFREFGQNMSIFLKMISSLSKRLRMLNNHIESLTLQDVSKRLANFLLNETKQNKLKGSVESVIIDISRADLASYLAVAPETLSRALGKFQENGLITVKNKSIKIDNLNSLVKIANG